MTIIETNMLTEHQQRKLISLQDACNRIEDLHNDTLLTNKFNLDRAMPCFFLGYSEDSERSRAPGALAAFLSLFHMEPQVMEITAFTSPGSRRNGYFTELFQAAMRQVRMLDVSTLLFQIESNSSSGMATLRAAFPAATFSHSEYLLSCTSRPGDGMQPLRMVRVDRDIIDLAVDIAVQTFRSDCDAERSHLEAVIDSGVDDAFIAYDGDEAIGICNRTLTEDSANLFGLGIKPSAQHRGYGKRMLSTMVRQMLDERTKVTLEVDTANPSALNLYLHGGFAIEFRTDYYALTLR
jgi:ribosomal protein S18 acetylase RimI-like enzyme